MNQLVQINQQQLEVKEFNGQRVVTFKDVDELHERPEGTARRNFNENKQHFTEGTHYFIRNSYEAKNEFGITAPNGLVLLTEKGYLKLVKSFSDDLAWQVQEILIDSYFRVKQSFEQLSPQLQALINLELRQKQLELQQAQLHNTLTLVKDTLIQRDDDWRNWVKETVNRIAQATGGNYQLTRAESYEELEVRARCKLGIRLTNLKDRLKEQGASKTKLNGVNKMDVIEDDPRLKEIYTSIIKEMSIKYTA